MKTETFHRQSVSLSTPATTFKVGAGDKFIDYIEVYDQSGNGKFDLVSVSALSNIGTTDLEFNVARTDADGDTAPASFSVDVTGSAIISAPSDTGALLTGTAASEYMIGKDGNDTLIGGAGDDILVGNLGSNSLTGELGNDTFVITKAIAGVSDYIADYTHLAGKGQFHRSHRPVRCKGGWN